MRGPSRRSLALAAARHGGGLLGLQKLGAIYGTDKASHTHTFNGRTYLEIYERYLHPLRRRRFTLLEIGVYRGDSLRTWRAYLRHATVIGLDIDPEAQRRAPDFIVYEGSQADPKLAEQIVERHPDLRVVIDDASHINPLTFASFEHFFPKLPSGGLYFIEDLSPAAYGTDWPGAHAHADGTWGTTWPGMAYNPDLSLLDNRRNDLEAFRNTLAYDCDLQPWDESIGTGIAFVHQFPGVLVIGKL
jgi:hypothetical protein